jgi:Kdo2-lipid IVA lauroyltransferase/acyltransferase
MPVIVSGAKERFLLVMAKTISKKIRQKIARDFVYYGLLIILPIIRAIPYRPALRLGAFSGRVVRWLLPFERRIANENLATAFPEKTKAERDEIARQVFMNAGRNLIEGIQLDKLRPKFDELIEVEGWDNFAKASKAGKGTIYITAHVGNWEIQGGYSALKGHPATVIAKEVYDPRLDAMLVEIRRKNRMDTIHRDDPNITMKIAQVLSQNHFLGILIDQDTKVRGVWVDFFGRPAFTPSGPAYLALTFGLPVMGGFIYRMANGKHKVVIVEPYYCESTGNLKEDIQRETQKMSDMVAGWIREHPTEWVWFHRRYKTQPPEENAG